MIPLLAPVLAELVTLNLGDRTEARYVVSGTPHAEAETRPLAGLKFDFGRAVLTVTYAPFIVAPKVDTDPSYLATYHTAALVALYQWRQTALGLSELGAYGERDLTADALGAARTPAITTTTPTQTGVGQPGTIASTPGSPLNTGTSTGTVSNLPANVQPRALPEVAHLQSFTTAASLTHRPSAATTLRADAGYTFAGGVGSSRADFPATRGPSFGLSAAQRVNGADQFTSVVTAQYASGAIDTRTWLSQINERWEHTFHSKVTVFRFGSGLSLSRNTQQDGLITYGVYPTFEIGIVHAERLANGTLTLALGAFSSPAIDPVRALVDPRIGGTGSVAWTRDRFTISTFASTTLSLIHSSSEGAFNNAGGAALTSYRLGAGFSVDCGVRAAYQTFEGQAVVPLSYAAFAGITYGAHVPLNGGRVTH